MVSIHNYSPAHSLRHDPNVWGTVDGSGVSETFPVGDRCSFDQETMWWLSWAVDAAAIHYVPLLKGMPQSAEFSHMPRFKGCTPSLRPLITRVTNNLCVVNVVPMHAMLVGGVRQSACFGRVNC